MNNKINLGFSLGALVMKSWVPKPCGHISNASNYDFPIYFQVVENSNTKAIHGGAQSIIPDILEAEKKCEDMGCKSIFTSCGYFGHFQRTIANHSSVPVYLSAVCLIPFIFRIMPKDWELGIICYNKDKLTTHLLEECGVTPAMRARCHVADVIGQPELSCIIKDQGHYNIDNGKNDVVNVARKLVSENINIGAILLECTDLPPHSYAIQEALGLPVFDSTTMIKFIHSLITNKISSRNLLDVIRHVGSCK